MEHNASHSIRTIDNPFTWCKNQEAYHRIHTKIDNFLGNELWFAEYSGIIVEVLEKGMSDHCPLPLDFHLVINRRIPSDS